MTGDLNEISTLGGPAHSGRSPLVRVGTVRLSHFSVTADMLGQEHGGEMNGILPPGQRRSLDDALERRVALRRVIKTAVDAVSVTEAKRELATLDAIFKSFAEYRDA